MIKPNVRVDSDAKLLADMMKETAEGATVPRSAISECAGRDIQASPYALNKAREILRKEHRVIFKAVHGIGFMRVANEDIPDLGDSYRSKIRKTARRATKVLTTVDYDKLSNEQRTKHNASLAVFGAISEVGQNKSLASVEKLIDQSPASLPHAKAALLALAGIG
jgi:hypothetical protein